MTQQMVPENTATSIDWRPASATDLGAMTELEQTLFPTDAWSRAIFSQELDLVPQTREYWVGIADSQTLVGYGGVSILVPDSEIMTFAIAPEFQGQGLGGQFLRLLLAQAQARGCQFCFLEVRADNEPAIRLYSSAGFVEIERRQRYYRDGVAAIVMSAELRDFTARLRSPELGQGSPAVKTEELRNE